MFIVYLLWIINKSKENQARLQIYKYIIAVYMTWRSEAKIL